MDYSMHMMRFVAYLRVEKRSSNHTVVAYKADLLQLSYYLAHLTPPKQLLEATTHDLRCWVSALAKQGLMPTSINRKIVAIRTFYNFLRKRSLTAVNPSYAIKSLKRKERLPCFFQERELKACFRKERFTSDFCGMRDRLIIELLYGTGIRLVELLSLRLLDIDLNKISLRVIGKRNRERMIPFPRPVARLIDDYLTQKSALGYGNRSSDLLLVTDKGKPCYPMFIYRVIQKYLPLVARVGQYSPHVFRHTFATHLLDKGADLKAIKELLGHASLATTQVYTHNALGRLKEVFQQAHPRAETED